SSTTTESGTVSPPFPAGTWPPWLAQPACSSPLVLLESSQNIWLMVRFCRAVISEIMSLDLRRSSICTDCHSPKDREEKNHFMPAACSCRRASQELHPSTCQLAAHNKRLFTLSSWCRKGKQQFTLNMLMCTALTNKSVHAPGALRLRTHCTQHEPCC
uniref:Uncharacterized protein n=1 Tax=Melopsittacus undulatus TaxID=13146 RepID=A0A8C6IQA5_MELUD